MAGFFVAIRTQQARVVGFGFLGAAAVALNAERLAAMERAGRGRHS